MKTKIRSDFLDISGGGGGGVSDVKVNGSSVVSSGVADITINNSTITLQQGGTTKGSFTLNQSGNQTINFDAGGGGGTINVIIYQASSFQDAVTQSTANPSWIVYTVV